MDAHIVVQGDSASGDYHWSNYGNGRNFDGKLTGKIEGNTLKLNLEIPDDPKASVYSDFTIELSMAEANPQEAKKARAFIKKEIKKMAKASNTGPATPEALSANVESLAQRVEDIATDLEGTKE